VYASKGELERALQTFKEVLAAAPPGSPDAIEGETFIKELEQSKPPA
jgi:hypothetical protein